MITNAMKATLVDELEFKPEEVDVMRPEIAAELIEKNMKRPFGDRPMPDQWKRDYDGGTGGGRVPGGMVCRRAHRNFAYKAPKQYNVIIKDTLYIIL